jgi:hypothetical protein
MPCIPDSLCRDLRTSYLLARMLWKEGYFISPLSRLPLLHWTVLDSKEAVDLIRIVQEIEVSKFCRQKSRRCFRRQTTQLVRRPRIGRWDMERARTKKRRVCRHEEHDKSPLRGGCPFCWIVRYGTPQDVKEKERAIKRNGLGSSNGSVPLFSGNEGNARTFLLMQPVPSSGCWLRFPFAAANINHIVFVDSSPFLPNHNIIHSILVFTSVASSFK